MCFNIYTNEVVTFEEAAETVEIKLQPMKHSVNGFQAEERGGSKAVFSTIKQTNMGDNAGKQCGTRDTSGVFGNIRSLGAPKEGEKNIMEGEEGK